MQEALYYQSLQNGEVQCLLCPHQCKISPGAYGRCKTRLNKNGTLITESYGILSAISSDPIEKKPLYHFHPGRPILSIGSFGCNFACDFCQNCEITQIDQHISSHYPSREPEDIVNKAALYPGNIGLAYTYNEPSVYYEYMLHCAALVKKRQLSNVMVTNGYINREPLEELLPHMDAFNVDLKSFRDNFYRERSRATLNPVLESIEAIAGSGKHLELTFLIIPGYNDSISEWKEMIHWIRVTCGSSSILHVSRYFPHYKMLKPPTPEGTISAFLKLAREQLAYVYPGNTPEMDNHSYCPSCGNLLIERKVYEAVVRGIGDEGQCSSCKQHIVGVFKNEL